MIACDIDALFVEADALIFAFVFEEDLGFPYLQAKTSEAVLKAGAAMELLVKVTRLMDMVSQEMQAQKALFALTGVIAHKVAGLEAAELHTRLRAVFTVVKMRREHLRRIPQDIRLCVRLLEDALGDERHSPGMEHVKRESALPTALSEAVDHDRADDHERWFR